MYNYYILCQLWWHKVPPQVQSKHLIKHFASLGSSRVMFSCSKAFDPWKQQQKLQWALCHSAYQPEPSACSTSSCKWPHPTPTHTQTDRQSSYFQRKGAVFEAADFCNDNPLVKKTPLPHWSCRKLTFFVDRRMMTVIVSSLIKH